MDLISWYSGLKTGVPLIDRDHEVLFSIVTTLNVAYKESQGRTVFFKGLTTLRSELNDHFAREESLMQDANYSNLVWHKQQHLELVSQIDTIITKIEEGSQMVTMTTMTFLRDWLTYHIQGSDMQFAAFLDSTTKD